MGQAEIEEEYMAKVTHEFDLYGKHYVLEAGELQTGNRCLYG